MERFSKVSRVQGNRAGEARHGNLGEFARRGLLLLHNPRVGNSTSKNFEQVTTSAGKFLTTRLR